MTFQNFLDVRSHGFVRVAVVIPRVHLADPMKNAAAHAEALQQVYDRGAQYALCPELGVTGYSAQDLFFSETLKRAALEALQALLRRSQGWRGMLVSVGMPIDTPASLQNCAVSFMHGKVYAVAPKSYPPNYREFYEGRHFGRAGEATAKTITLFGRTAPFGADLLLKSSVNPDFVVHTEICEDLWTPVPPSSWLAMAGATIICNPSASSAIIGKPEYRQLLVKSTSARLLSAYIYSGAGQGESTTDLAWDGHAMIYENGNLLGESERFQQRSQVVCADLDLESLAQDRMRMTTFGRNAFNHKEKLAAFRRVFFTADFPGGEILLEREYPRFPYIPADPLRRDQRCYEAYNIQVQGLSKRLQSSGINNVVIGISGGLDSTQALIVAARTMDLLNLPRSNIKAYTMPGFATTDKTYKNALKLMESLGVEANEIDIKPGSLQMLKDIGHPFAQGKKLYDITFENVQAGERTSHLFRLANMRDAIVVGTGDLSELALGWCTYGVGDHMSHYNVNVSVPKTLIQHLIRWVARTVVFSRETSEILFDILETEITPELVPGKRKDVPAQKTEALVGPYELHDFTTFYITRFGFLPTKIAFMAYCTWKDKTKGHWPDVPEEKRHAYTLKEIKHWLSVYLLRFFKYSQFKRSCLPNGPKVGSGGSLSPRGDYRAPSDSEATVWLENVKEIPERQEYRP